MGSTRSYNHGGSKARSARQWTCQKSKKWQPGRRAARSRSRESALPSQQRFHARRSARHEAVLVPGPLSLTLLRAAPRGRAARPGAPAQRQAPATRRPPRSGHVRRGGTDKARTCCAGSPGWPSSAPPGLPREAGTPRPSAAAGQHPTERGTRSRRGTKRGQAAGPARRSGRGCSSGAGRAPAGAYSPGCGAPGARAGRADAGRSRVPPAPAGLRRPPPAASQLLAAPARAKTPPPSARKRRPRAADPPPPAPRRPPAGHANARLSPSVGAAAAAARDPARPRDGNEKPHPAGRQCAAAAPLGGAAPPACSPPLPAGVRGPCRARPRRDGAARVPAAALLREARSLRERVAARRAGLACQWLCNLSGLLTAFWARVERKANWPQVELVSGNVLGRCVIRYTCGPLTSVSETTQLITCLP